MRIMQGEHSLEQKANASGIQFRRGDVGVALVFDELLDARRL
jgi:hypothetical protein